MVQSQAKTKFDTDIGFLEDKNILVSGGTGSFGKTLVGKLLNSSGARRVIVYSRDEFKQSLLQQRYPHDRYPQLRLFIGDIRDVDRLKFALHGVDYVFHAAALKQVPAAEYNPFECIKTNVIGAENVVRASIEMGVKKVVALSTDKAAAPINIYGASKLASDKIFVAANHMGVPRGTTFSVVRYGNVIGSRGSVVPFFKDMVAQGATELPITDPEMTRFFIHMEEGVDFSLSVLKMLVDTNIGGEIFVPKLPSARIVDIASAIGPKLVQKIVGIRPGEKIHEEMITVGDAPTTLDLGDRFVIEPQMARWNRTGFDTLGGTPMERDFVYNSGSNDVWLQGDGLRANIEAAISQAEG